MTSQKTEIPHVLLDIGDLDADEKKRDELCGAIKKNAPQSTLYTASPTIQAQVALVDSTNTTYKGSLVTAAASKKQHDLDVAAANKARVNANKAIRMLAKMTENDAVTADDIKSMAFTAYTGKPTPPPLVAPVVKYTPGKKGSGMVTVSADETGLTRHRYAAQQSLDGTTYTASPGGGKTRKLFGKPGTSMWMQMALERGQLRSEWSQPIQVVFP